MAAEKKYGVMVNQEGVTWHEGRTLEELVSICDWADEKEESMEDFFGDLAIIPKITRELIEEIRSLKEELASIRAV